MKEYEKAIKDEAMRKQNAERAHAELGQRNQENE
jgi:hypothetical protein